MATRISLLVLLIPTLAFGEGSETVKMGTSTHNVQSPLIFNWTGSTHDFTGSTVSGLPGGGTVTSITATTPIVVTPTPLVGTGVITIADTAVTPGSYTNTNLTVDAKGRITAASNGSAGGGSGTVTSVGLAGTSNQITVTGTSPITTSGSFTLSIPTAAQINIAKLTNLTTNGFVTTSGSDGTLGIDTSTYLTSASAASTYQPLDSDLTTIAGLTATTDNFMIGTASAWSSRTPAQARTSLALVIGTNVQAWDTDLDTWATKTPYAGTVVVTTGKTFTDTNNLTLSGTDGSTLNIGTGGTLGTAAYTASTAYQVADSDLTTWAGITPGTGVGTALAVNVGTAGAFVVNGGTLGTPSSGSAANLTSFPVSAMLDTLGSTRGMILFRGFSNWTVLAPGAVGAVLTSNSSSSDPTWETVSGSVTNVTAQDITTVSQIFATAAVSSGATTPDLTYILEPSPAHKFFGNNTGTSDFPDYKSITSGDVPTLNQNTTGSAATLTTARNLWGQSFNGSANIGGAIELGTAGTTDTTLDRVSAGVASLEGVNILTTATGQPLDSDLTTIAGLTATTDNFLVSVSSAWASRTPSQVRTTLGLVIGTNVQAWDTDLDTWATVTPGTGVATFLATPSSANFATAVTGETGSGALVFGTSPDFTTGATIGSVAIPTISSTNTLTNKNVVPRTRSTTSATSWTPDFDTYDQEEQTALAGDITAVNAPTFTGATNGSKRILRIKNNATPHNIGGWNSIYVVMGTTLPLTIGASKTIYIGLIYNGNTSKWDVVAVATEA